MSEGASDKLIELVKRSELVAPARLDDFLGKLRKQDGVPTDHAKLADLLVRDDLLTRWQADKLLAGKHKGFRLGKYKLLGSIGKGGMSHVYLAEHMLMERRVAIKVLPRQRVKDRSYLSRFQLEARAAARLDDPNIVRVYDIDNEGDTHYIVMEYVDGRDLHQTVSQDGPLPFNTAAKYVAQVATGLQHAHEMGLVHRDIKPANCLVDPSQTVKLLDMGLAKLTDDETSLTLANDENVLGTADYLAPEQALNSHAADARADIYSLGCTLYFLLTGRPPFPEGTISERLLKHQVEQPESLLKLRADCPLSLVDICMRMMAKKPDDRPQTAGEVARLLNEWLADRGESTVAGGRSPSGSDAPKVRDSGVGSGILSRYQQATGSDSAKGPSPGDTARLYSSGSFDTDEDIGLAPIDDEDEDAVRRARKAAQNKKASASSGVLSDDSGEKLSGSKPRSGSGTQRSGGKPAAGSGKTGKTSGSSAKNQSDDAVAASLSSPAKKVKPKSIFDEDYETPAADPVSPRASRSAEYDPLHPPGYRNPYTRTPKWVWGLVGMGAIAILYIIFRVLFG